MIPNQTILAILDAYTRRFSEEAAALEELRGLVEGGGAVTSRKHTLGHLTAGALLIRDGQLLMLHHNFLDIWLMPGGHIDDDDASLRDAALRELLEESGLTDSEILPFDRWPDDLPLDIGRHAIPPRPERDEAAHIHWDVRFCFATQVTGVSPPAAEVKAWQWREVSQAPDRVGPKLAVLFET